MIFLFYFALYVAIGLAVLWGTDGPLRLADIRRYWFVAVFWPLVLFIFICRWMLKLTGFRV